MDVVSLGFLLLMVLLGGVSAFLADYLAWRIGKRRLSMMNMRPKHFARLVVTVAGMLIPLFTILAVAGASSDVRTWIAQGRTAAIQLPEVTRERDARVAEVRALEGQRRRLEDENRQAGAILAQRNASLDQQKTVLDQQKTTLNDQKDQIDAQNTKLGNLALRLKNLVAQGKLSTAKVTLLSTKTANAQNALTKAQAAVVKANAEVQQSTGELRFIKGESESVKAESKKAREDYEETNKQNLKLTQANLDVEAKRAELQARTDELAAEIARLEGDRITAQKNAEVAQKDLDELEGRITELQDSQSALRLILRQTNALARIAPLAFRRGDELGRLVVPAGSSVAAAKGIVRNLVASTADGAERRGAQAGGGTPITYLGEAEPKTKGLSPEAKVEYWGGQLAGRKGDTVLVATSEYNFFVGEAVALALAPYDDPTVFQSGEVVAEARVDGRRPDATVYAQIAEFLGTRVQERARKEGLIPLRSGGEASFGEVTTAQILDAVREIREADRPVRLQALADGEVRAGDRLKLTLRIR